MASRMMLFLSNWIVLRSAYDKLWSQHRDTLAASVSSGVCCCGDPMAQHASPMNCGHSPVDEWDHHAELSNERLLKQKENPYYE